ncbi:hypothetical protein [Stenotrophomonas chelatiphaga]|jgi:hypothetical protein|uniref:hypothetical protein n=1 Tax=Stenotrophomonas chelatiphaga TaxID=517011 RepID=UPI00289995A2|nr:hypothetical protein [Stenotrophomonas chelatiphaga]
MLRSYLPLLTLLVCGSATASPADASRSDAYIEFLWSKTPDGALARQETRSFALDRRFDHQVCVAILNASIVVRSIQLRAVGPDGQQITSTTYRDVDGTKRCFSAFLPATAPTGKWTYEVRLNEKDQVVVAQSIDVFETVDALIARTAPGMPYVLGRPNYDSSMPPDTFSGEITWVMHVERDGTVSDVDIESAEGVGVIMKPKALAAGRISLFPPDATRSDGATFRRHLSFRPDH